MKTSLPFLRCSVILAAAILFWATACSRAAPPPFECTDRIGCVNLEPEEPIKIGVLQALSGKIAPLGVEQIRGFELAVDHWGGKVLARRIVFQTEDTGCSGEGGANAALKIIADPQTVAILGTTCSGAAATAAQAMSDAGLTMISGNNSAPFLTAIAGQRAPNWQAGYFRTAANEEHSGKAAAIYAFTELGVRKAATIDDGDIYTRGLTDGFRQAFESLGGEIVLAAAVNKGDTEMRAVLAAVLQSSARLLFFPLFQPEGNLVLTAARKTSGFEDIVLMSDGALIENSFIASVMADGIGMYFVGPAKPASPDIDALAAAYKAKYTVAPATSYYLNAYDAANLLFSAIATATVAEADGRVHIGRQALREALYQTKVFNGVSGSLTCDAFGDCATPVFNVLRLDDPAAGIDGLLANVRFTYRPTR